MKKNRIRKLLPIIVVILIAGAVSIYSLKSSSTPLTPTTTPPTPSPVLPSSVPYSVFYESATDGFVIDYLPTLDTYKIGITGSPFSLYRQAAEKKFLELTNFTPEKACQQKVLITSPVKINPETANEAFGLSFCN